jgi:hypothetical protein
MDTNPPNGDDTTDSQGHTGWSSVPNWVVRSGELSTSEKLVYISLLNRADSRGYSHPSLNVLSRDAGISRRTTIRTLGALENRQLIERMKRARRDGTQDSNKYRVAAWARSRTASSLDGAILTPRSDKMARGSDTGNRGVVPQWHGGSDTGNHEVLPIEVQPSSTTQEYAQTRVDAQFGEFWSVYPNRRDKKRARSAFANALKRGATFDVILSSARRYRDDPNREDAFTKHPTTWLNGDCWEDPPLPNRRDSPRPRTQSTTDDRVRGGLALAARLAAEESESERREITS